MKWYGEIGFKEEVEVEAGVWEPKIVTRKFFGDVLKDVWRDVPADKINADFRVSNRLSIVADKYLQTNFHKIAYVTFGGAKWTVGDVEADFPRLTLSLSSLYIEEAGEVYGEDEG